MKLVFASGNPGKIREAQEILGDGVEIVPAASLGITEDIPETGSTLKENSLQKAQYIYKKTGLDCFADDSGLEVDLLGGAPGVETARYAGPDKNPEKNIVKLLHEMEIRGGEPRTARFRTCVTLVLNGEPHFFEGVMEGRITYEKAGRGGFGYDPVFIPDGYDKTNAELPESLKNAISHRGKALRAMEEILRSAQNDN